MRRWLRRIAALALIVYGPLIYLHFSTPIFTIEDAEPAEAAIVFGAVVRDGGISALHAERLDTAADLWRRGAARTIVVSNAERAAEVMRDYLLGKGVAASAIQMDGDAIATPDTCLREFQRPARRSVLLISQRYHLPRIGLQCSAFQLDAQLVAANRVGPKATTGAIRTAVIRLRRHTREALLVWSEMLGFYRALSSWKEGWPVPS